MKKLIKKWWFWLIVVLVISSVGYYTWNWYHTRISPNTPQAKTGDCPSDKLIKGNAQSGIYHMPGGQYYKETRPERCFANEKEAQDAGYRRSKK